MSCNTILFLVEGNSDKSLINQLKGLLSNESYSLFPSAKIITYNTCIYPLYKDIEQDDDLDVVALIKDKDTSGELKNLNKGDVSEIYLFFDYDPHTTNASNEKLEHLLDFFNNETDKGKLYVSYPMLEVFRHGYKLTGSVQNSVSLL